jgi:hypothetical protein
LLIAARSDRRERGRGRHREGIRIGAAGRDDLAPDRLGRVDVAIRREYRRVEKRLHLRRHPRSQQVRPDRYRQPNESSHVAILPTGTGRPYDCPALGPTATRACRHAAAGDLESLDGHPLMDLDAKRARPGRIGPSNSVIARRGAGGVPKAGHYVVLPPGIEIDTRAKAGNPVDADEFDANT